MDQYLKNIAESMAVQDIELYDGFKSKRIIVKMYQVKY